MLFKIVRDMALTGLLLTSSTTAFCVPDNAWNSHIHIIDPERFPFSPDRSYTPKPATVHNATKFEEGREIKHATVVLPSVYGTCNDVLLDALKYFKGRYRGVAVIDPDNVSNSTLDEMHELGVRGLRVNMNDASDDETITAIRKIAAVAKLKGWVVQIWVPISVYTKLHDIVPELGVTLAADHFAHAEVGSRTNNMINTIDPYKTPGFPEVIDLVQRRLRFTACLLIILVGSGSGTLKARSGRREYD